MIEGNLSVTHQLTLQDQDSTVFIIYFLAVKQAEEVEWITQVPDPFWHALVFSGMETQSKVNVTDMYSPKAE